MQVVVKRDKPELAAADVLAVFLRQEKSLPPKSVVAPLDTRLGGRIRDYLDSGVQRGQILAEAVRMARDLSNSPGNEVNPAYLTKQAQEIAAKTTLRCHVLDVDGIREHRMGCLLGVAQGSEQPPAFIILEHAPKGSREKPIVLVGKGITFDSGGISIKPAANMEDMK